jgi:hypothetical protein
VLKEGLFFMGVQKLEEIFSLHNYEISLTIYIIWFDVIEYSMRNNKKGKQFGG